MALALFDLDETLIAGDSDHAWGEFVVRKGLVDADSHRARNNAFYEDYKKGVLDVDAYLRFACSLLKEHTLEELLTLRDEFVATMVQPMLQPRAMDLIEQHRARGDTLIIITATIEFITRPIADLHGISELIAPIPALYQGRYTGEISGVPSMGQGKVTRLHEWLLGSEHRLADSCFYSDSANDLPLLEVVDHPFCVDPDPRLKAVAEARQWPILSLRS